MIITQLLCQYSNWCNIIKLLKIFQDMVSTIQSDPTEQVQLKHFFTQINIKIVVML